MKQRNRRSTRLLSARNKTPRHVSILAESIAITVLFKIRPVLEGSGRDADPFQRQTAGSVCLSEKKRLFFPNWWPATQSGCYGHLVPRLIGVMPDHWLAVLLAKLNEPQSLSLKFY